MRTTEFLLRNVRAQPWNARKRASRGVLPVQRLNAWVKELTS